MVQIRAKAPLQLNEQISQREAGKDGRSRQPTGIEKNEKMVGYATAG